MRRTRATSVLTTRVAVWWSMTALLLSACGPLNRSANLSPATIPIWGRSHNRSDVDVYLLCGNVDARWLGVVLKKQRTAFEIPSADVRCASGLNFFLVVRDLGRGYWVGPVRPRPGGHIDLVIEKYAGLSAARTRR
jgi:hypothetical protein